SFSARVFGLRAATSSMCLIAASAAALASSAGWKCQPQAAAVAPVLPAPVGLPGGHGAFRKPRTAMGEFFGSLQYASVGGGREFDRSDGAIRSGSNPVVQGGGWLKVSLKPSADISGGNWPPVSSPPLADVLVSCATAAGNTTSVCWMFGR